MRPPQPPTFPARFVLAGLSLLGAAVAPVPAADAPRLRVIVETDAGGDPDDEQSLVRFLLYANEWDVGGIIVNRPEAGSYRGEVPIAGAASPEVTVRIPADAAGKTVHVLLTVRDRGAPPLARYRRAVVTCEAPPGVEKPTPRSTRRRR